MAEAVMATMDARDIAKKAKKADKAEQAKESGKAEGDFSASQQWHPHPIQLIGFQY